MRAHKAHKANQAHEQVIHVKHAKHTSTQARYLIDSCVIHLKKMRPFNFPFCPPNTTLVLFLKHKTVPSSTVIDCFFDFFDAQNQDNLVSMVNTFADFRAMLN